VIKQNHITQAHFYFRATRYSLLQSTSSVSMSKHCINKTTANYAKYILIHQPRRLGNPTKRPMHNLCCKFWGKGVVGGWRWVPWVAQWSLLIGTP